MPITIFDKKIENLLEDIFIEIQRVYLKQDGIPYHFLGYSRFINIKNFEETTQLYSPIMELEKVSCIKE